MPDIRVMPRLDIKGPNVVKGVHLEGLRVIGQPAAFARHYYQTGADELLYMDVVASLYERNSLHEIVERTSRELFIPLTVGGGLRTLNDIRSVLLAGADKVALNTAAIRDPGLITRAAERFGSSTITVSIEAKRRPNGEYEAYTDNGRERTGREVVAWGVEAWERGAGELLVTSVDQEGTGHGYDIGLVKALSSKVAIPVIACGGAGMVAHVVEVVRDGCADAVCLASMLHYAACQLSACSHGGEAEGNMDFLRRPKAPANIVPASLQTLKRGLDGQGIACRFIPSAEDGDG